MKRPRVTVLLQFGHTFPTPEQYTSSKTYNMMHVLEVRPRTVVPTSRG